MRNPKFEIFQSDKDGLYYFRLKARNGKIVLQSEGYTRKENAEGGIEAVRQLSQDGDNFLYSLRSVGDEPRYWHFVIEAENSEVVGSSETYTSKAGAKKGIESVRRCAPIAEIVDKTKD